MQKMKTLLSAGWRTVRNPAVLVLLVAVLATTVTVWVFTDGRIQEELSLIHI